MPSTVTQTWEETEAVDVARKLSSCVALLSREAGRSLTKWDMTWPQAMSLLLLRAQPEPVNATQLVEQLGLGRTAMTAVVDRLQRRGWVERRPHLTDRRVQLLELTELGRSVAAESAAVVGVVLDRLMQAASVDSGFDSVTDRVVDRLRHDLPQSD